MNKIRKFLNIFILLQLLTLIALGALTYYLYKVRVVEHIKYENKRVDIVDNTLTKVQAESKSLESLVIKNTNTDFKELQIGNTKSDNLIQPTYKLTNESVVETTNKVAGAIPMFYTDRNSDFLNDQEVINSITEIIKINSLNEIDIDVSITNKVENIETVVKDIIYNLNPSDIKINVGLPLKWSDNMDYSYLDFVSNFYKSNASLEVLNNLCNKLRIHAYELTNINSANAGPISNIDTVKNSLNYYSYKGIALNKVSLVINNRGYMWSNRTFTDNQLYNYTLLDQQVKIIDVTSLNEYLSSSNFKIINNLPNGENIAELKEIDGIKYIIYPNLSQITTLIESAKNAGLDGYIILSESY